MSDSVFGKTAAPNLNMFEADRIGKKLDDVKGGLLQISPSHHLVVAMCINCSVHNTPCGTDDLYPRGLQHCFDDTRRMS